MNAHQRSNRNRRRHSSQGVNFQNCFIALAVLLGAGSLVYFGWYKPASNQIAAFEAEKAEKVVAAQAARKRQEAIRQREAQEKALAGIKSAATTEQSKLAAEREAMKAEQAFMAFQLELTGLSVEELKKRQEAIAKEGKASQSEHGKRLTSLSTAITATYPSDQARTAAVEKAQMALQTAKAEMELAERKADALKAQLERKVKEEEKIAAREEAIRKEAEKQLAEARKVKEDTERLQLLMLKSAKEVRNFANLQEVHIEGLEKDLQKANTELVASIGDAKKTKEALEKIEKIKDELEKSRKSFDILDSLAKKKEAAEAAATKATAPPATPSSSKPAPVVVSPPVVTPPPSKTSPPSAVKPGPPPGGPPPLVKPTPPPTPSGSPPPSTPAPTPPPASSTKTEQEALMADMNAVLNSKDPSIRRTSISELVESADAADKKLLEFLEQCSEYVGERDSGKSGIVYAGNFVGQITSDNRLYGRLFGHKSGRFFSKRTKDQLVYRDATRTVVCVVDRAFPPKGKK